MKLYVEASFGHYMNVVEMFKEKHQIVTQKHLADIFYIDGTIPLYACGDTIKYAILHNKEWYWELEKILPDENNDV